MRRGCGERAQGGRGQLVSFFLTVLGASRPAGPKAKGGEAVLPLQKHGREWATGGFSCARRDRPVSRRKVGVNRNTRSGRPVGQLGVVIEGYCVVQCLDVCVDLFITCVLLCGVAGGVFYPNF